MRQVPFPFLPPSQIGPFLRMQIILLLSGSPFSRDLSLSGVSLRALYDSFPYAGLCPSSPGTFPMRLDVSSPFPLSLTNALQ